MPPPSPGLFMVEPLARSTGHQTWYAAQLLRMNRECFPSTLVTFDGLHDDADLHYGRRPSECLRVRPRLPGILRRLFTWMTGIGEGRVAAPSTAVSPARIYRYNQAATILTVLFALCYLPRRNRTLIHFLCPPALPSLLCVALLRSREHRCVFTAFASPERYRGAGWLTRSLCRARRVAIVVQTESLRQQWARVIPDRSVHLVPLVCNDEASPMTQQACRETLGLPPEGKIVAVIGALTPAKGYPELFAGLRGRSHDFRVLLLGDTPTWLDDDLETVVAAAGWTDSTIIRREFLPERLMPSLFGAIDAAALLYRQSDASSGILALCRRFGVPVLATSHGELGRIVREEHLGVVADPADPQAVHAALCEVLSAGRRASGTTESQRLYQEAMGVQHRLYRTLGELE